MIEIRLTPTMEQRIKGTPLYNTMAEHGSYIKYSRLFIVEYLMPFLFDDLYHMGLMDGIQQAMTLLKDSNGNV